MSPQRRKKKTTPETPRLMLRLYIVENAILSNHAIANLKAICKKHLADHFKLEIVDVLNEPRQIIKHQILATPTLIKLSPEPVRTIIGDLSDEKKVLDALGITPAPSSS
ncbi:MAG: circadian clock protein KaiB [Chthoniobacteraceae bacterium]|nr:circadian clock protein KaiB [Chthoniobacteraceae bacterium]